MWDLLWPVAVVVAANCVYHVAAKSTPSNANAFGSLLVTYLTAAGLSAALFFGQAGPGNVLPELRKLNWTSPLLGAAIVGLEFGSICVYRAGWKISAGSLVSNIALACILVFVGMLLYRETITPRQLLGIGVCLAGLFLVSEI